jgi:hypothetical protein
VLSPHLGNLDEPIKDFAMLTRFFNDNTKNGGTHRILVRSENLMSMQEPAFDKMRVRKFVSGKGELNSTHFKKLVRLASKSRKD